MAGEEVDVLAGALVAGSADVMKGWSEMLSRDPRETSIGAIFECRGKAIFQTNRTSRVVENLGRSRLDAGSEVSYPDIEVPRGGLYGQGWLETPAGGLGDLFRFKA